jgi:hypothetical protein
VSWQEGEHMMRTNHVVVGLVMLTALYGAVAEVGAQGHSGNRQGDRLTVEQEAL